MIKEKNKKIVVRGLTMFCNHRIIRHVRKIE